MSISPLCELTPVLAVSIRIRRFTGEYCILASAYASSMLSTATPEISR